MGKNYVLNFDGELYLGDIINARKTAIKEGYDFFRFNGIVYFIDEDKNIHKTIW